MPKTNPKNERIKRDYLQWQETAKGASVKNTDMIAASISRFEKSTGGKDFAVFHINQAVKYKRDLEKPNPKTGKPLSKATIRSRLMAVKHFFKWLADRPGYKSRIRHADCEYFNLTANDTRVATAYREQPVPSLEQIHYVIAHAPYETPTEMRDRALIAFTLLTGMRDAAIASLPIGKVDVDARRVDQDARIVRTKNAKTMQTFFFQWAVKRNRSSLNGKLIYVATCYTPILIHVSKDAGGYGKRWWVCGSRIGTCILVQRRADSRHLPQAV